MDEGKESRPAVIRGRHSASALRAFVAAGVAATLFCLSANSAEADWRKEIGTFRIGVLAEPGGGKTIAGLGELTRAFSNALGLPVEFYVADSYAALVDALAAGEIESASLSALAFAAASERCRCVEPVVAPVGEDGSIGIRSVLISRDGKLASLAGIKDRKVALSPPDSVAGYQLPLSEVSVGGGRMTGTEPFLVPAPSPAAAETMLVDGKVDALFGWTSAAEPGSPDPQGGTPVRLADAGVDPATLTVVWKSQTLRYGPHTVRAALDPEAKRRLTVFLLGLKAFDPDQYERLETQRLGGFRQTTAQDYAPAVAIVRMFGARVAAE